MMLQILLDQIGRQYSYEVGCLVPLISLFDQRLLGLKAVRLLGYSAPSTQGNDGKYDIPQILCSL